jgi:hypothetical protein
MLATIQFNNKIFLVANKINVLTNRFLPPELQTMQLLSTYVVP